MDKKKNATLWIVLMCLGAACIIGLMVFSGIKSVEFDKDKTGGNRTEAIYADDEYEDCYVPAKFLSAEFASYENDDTQGLYIAFDENRYPYIMVMYDDTFTNYLDLYNYTYQDSATDPGIVNLFGSSHEIDSEMEDAAIDAYNDLMGSTIVDESNFSSYFGKYYFDMDDGNSVFVNTVFDYFYFFALGLILIIAGLIMLLKSNDYNRKLVSRMATNYAGGEAVAGNYGNPYDFQNGMNGTIMPGQHAPDMPYGKGMVQTGQPAQKSYRQPASNGYPQQTQPGYPQQAQPGYPQQTQPGYPQQTQPGYPQQAQPGYPQQTQTPVQPVVTPQRMAETVYGEQVTYHAQSEPSQPDWAATPDPTSDPIATSDAAMSDRTATSDAAMSDRTVTSDPAATQSDTTMQS